MKKVIFIVFIITILSCFTSKELVSNTDTNTDDENTNPKETTLNILSLGDSYTVGHSVCETCRFPEQLKQSLNSSFDTQYMFDLKVIAQTGWTTTNLINAIASENITNNNDLVTLLIGVNNQYQGKPFSLYETEFPDLVQTAITAANGDKSNVVVVSIPDYGYTPFGQKNMETISSEIDAYNNFAETYCEQNNITYLYITDITRQGLENTALVASDGLHPSELAYAKFVERILPLAIEKIE